MADFSWDLFHRLPVVGILRHLPAEALPAVIGAVQRGGLLNLEVTMNSAAAGEQIAAICELTDGAMNVGAGTVTSLARLEVALAAGASYIVTPVVNAEVIRACVERQVPVMPGAFTPTEVWQAHALGAAMVKLFPASRLGPAYLKDLKGPLDEIPILATGGVTPDSLPAWHAAGASGYGVGSPLFAGERIKAADWPWVEAQARRFAEAYASCS